MPLAVTCSGHCEPKLVQRARAGAAAFGLPFIARGQKQALSELLESDADAFLVYGADGLTLWDKEGWLRFTPGMAHLRVKHIDSGFRDDHLIRLGELRDGDQVLDCTLGLCADALVAARAVGPEGRVVGVEKSRAVLAVVTEGLAAHDPGPRSCRVELVAGDAAEVLRQSADGSFDCVLFDPMFAKPRRSSEAFESLRRHADYTPLTPQMLEDARRVARRWVLIKAARYSTDLKKLGLRPEPGRRSATVVWARVAAG
ncbi:MAG: class I SAM-dependent methyltransferase [Myxococcaceae bacterium]